MRRTPYTERGYRQTQNISIKEPGDFLTYTANKSDLPQRQSQNIQTYMQAKNTKPYHMPSRNARSTSKRPISVNKSNSGIKSRSKLIYIQTRIGKKYPQEIKIFGYLLSEKISRELIVETMSIQGERYTEAVPGNLKRK